MQSRKVKSRKVKSRSRKVKSRKVKSRKVKSIKVKSRSRKVKSRSRKVKSRTRKVKFMMKKRNLPETVSRTGRIIKKPRRFNQELNTISQPPISQPPISQPPISQPPISQPIEISGLHLVAVMKSKEFDKNIFLFGEIHGNDKNIQCKDTNNEAPDFILALMNIFLKIKEKSKYSPDSKPLENLDVIFEFFYSPSKLNNTLNYFEEGFKTLRGARNINIEKNIKKYKEVSNMLFMIAKLYKNRCLDFIGNPTEEDLKLCPYLNDVRFHVTDSRDTNKNRLVKTTDIFSLFFLGKKFNQEYITEATSYIIDYSHDKELFFRDFHYFTSLFKINKYLLEIKKYLPTKYKKIYEAVYLDFNMLEEFYKNITAKNGSTFVIQEIITIGLSKGMNRMHFQPYHLKTIDAFISLWVWFMDAYLVLRIFKKFDKKDDSRKRISGEMKNVIIYSGATHTENYINFFEKIGFEKVFFKRGNLNRPNCVDVTDMFKHILFR